MSDNSILSQLTSVPEQGALLFSDVRYLLIRPETLAAFQDMLETEIGFERAGEILYTGGFTGGKLSGQKYKESYNLSDKEAVEFMCRMGGEIGWGAMKIQHLDSSKKRLTLKVTHSPFAEAYLGKANHVCHLIRGVFGGLCTWIFGTEIDAQETKCIADGDDFCLFDYRETKK
ncbi:MAG: hypothetical protein FVQ83_14355 [Chloroflexi bacterium]|nr:hypothetical protein [Chloroflexota bacterium]